MKASNSKSQTEYIELADVVGVYLDVRHSIHSAHSPLVPHGVIELRCVPWHLCCKLPISMLHVANCPFRRCMLPHGALRTAAGAVAVVSPRQQRSSSTTSCSTTRTLPSSARCSAERARATRSSAASSSAPLRTDVATAPMQHRRAATLAPPPQPRGRAQPAEGGGAAAVDGPRRRRLGFAVAA